MLEEVSALGVCHIFQLDNLVYTSLRDETRASIAGHDVETSNLQIYLRKTTP